MPVISMFYGVIVMMYYFDNRRHHQPHIHIKYGDEKAVVSIPNGEIIEGTNQGEQNEISAGLD